MTLIKIVNYIKKMCTPAQLYLALSLFSMLLLLIHNLGNKYKYSCIRTIHTRYHCNYYFIIKLIYILFWTWVLQFLCMKGYTNLSWIILFFPYLLMIFILIMFVFLMGTNKLKSILKKK